jgi:hypothetical protein
MKPETPLDRISKVFFWLLFPFLLAGWLLLNEPGALLAIVLPFVFLIGLGIVIGSML